MPDLPFKSGCSTDDVRRLEETLGVPLPDDYKMLLRCVNGQSDWNALSFPPDRVVLLGADEVLALWREFSDVCDDELLDELVCDGRVRWTVCHPGRIPIAQNETAGAYLCIDKIPGPAGHLDQLVFNVNETDCVVVGENVALLAFTYVKMLESGAAEITRKPPEYGDGYEFTANGMYMDFYTYDGLETPRSGS
ncbi:SMI1/KNR4 family protein [Streptomyces nodosus]|uniref:SMI1/KNR4 family protein n=1 Tax=Streptomyces nodosus TaxID=40318 RepID=UPI0036EEC8E8